MALVPLPAGISHYRGRCISETRPTGPVVCAAECETALGGSDMSEQPSSERQPAQSQSNDHSAQGLADASEDSLAARIKRVRTAWGRALIVLSVLTLGIGGYIQKQVEDNILTVWQIVG
jgi:hypothetical protein